MLSNIKLLEMLVVINDNENHYINIIIIIII